MPRISRTTNPTSLKELDAKLFSVRIQTQENGTRSFWLERFDFSKSGLDSELRLACVAHAGNTEEYFELGALDSPLHEVKSINELASNRPLKFRFLVYEHGHPRLVAFADNVRAVDDAGTLGDSLVDIEPTDLNGPVWRLHIPEVKPDTENPVLQVERQFFPTTKAASRDTWIAVMVMPEVMRQIANVISHHPECLEDSEVWISKWLQYLTGLGCTLVAEDWDETARSQWVDEVVERFCARPTIRNHLHTAIAELSGET